MGYAIFTTRKLSLVDRIFRMQSEILNITNEKNELLDLSSAISDGEVSSTDIAACSEAGILISYEKQINQEVANSHISEEYQTGKDKAKSEADAMYSSSFIQKAWHEIVTLGGLTQWLWGDVCGVDAKKEARKEYVENYEEEYNHTKLIASAEKIERELQKKENELDKRQKTLETKLTQAQTELQSVEQAEAKAVEQSTPRYAGLG